MGRNRIKLVFLSEFQILSVAFSYRASVPSEPYVLVTATSMSIGLEDVCDTCFRLFSSKLMSAVRLKNMLVEKTIYTLTRDLETTIVNLILCTFLAEIVIQTRYIFILYWIHNHLNIIYVTKTRQILLWNRDV